jgi:hypothetical protein
MYCKIPVPAEFSPAYTICLLGSSVRPCRLFCTCVCFPVADFHTGAQIHAMKTQVKRKVQHLALLLALRTRRIVLHPAATI